MKKIFLFLNAYFFFCAHKGKTKCSDLIQQDLKGKVQQLEETTYDTDTNGNEKLVSVRIIVCFDKDEYAKSTSIKMPLVKIVMNETASHYTNGAIQEFLNAAGERQISNEY